MKLCGCLGKLFRIVRRFRDAEQEEEEEPGMSDLPISARVVVIGAGIVGNSVVKHLAALGWRDIVQLDKGPLPNPGGSTGHASNFIYPVDHNKEMAHLTLDSQEQYEEMGVSVPREGSRSPVPRKGSTNSTGA